MRRTPPGIPPAYGSSKDHRPYLKHLRMTCMLVYLMNAPNPGIRSIEA
jgi:hypothetical protein